MLPVHIGSWRHGTLTSNSRIVSFLCPAQQIDFESGVSFHTQKSYPMVVSPSWGPICWIDNPIRHFALQRSLACLSMKSKNIPREELGNICYVILSVSSQTAVADPQELLMTGGKSRDTETTFAYLIIYGVLLCIVDVVSCFWFFWLILIYQIVSTKGSAVHMWILRHRASATLPFPLCVLRK